jgi:hypothetical protein
MGAQVKRGTCTRGQSCLGNGMGSEDLRRGGSSLSLQEGSSRS